MTISADKKVSIEYTLRLEDQSVIDTNVGGAPLTFVQGAHQIIPGLEKEMDGLKVGDSKKVTVRPEEGYGVVDPKAFREVDQREIPKESQHVGAELNMRDAMGRNQKVRVAEVNGQTILLDFNHPLAGKTLYFEVKVLDIQEPPVQ